MRKRSERVESPSTYVTESSTRPILLGLVFFRTVLSCSGGYHQEKAGMPLHGAAGINYKNGGTSEYQEADAKYMG